MKKIIRITGVPILLMLSLVGCSSGSNVKEDQIQKDLVGRELNVHNDQAIGVQTWKISDKVKVKVKDSKLGNDNTIEYETVDIEDSKIDIYPLSAKSDLYSHKISPELVLMYRYYDNSWKLQTVTSDKDIVDTVKNTGDHVKIPKLNLTVDKVMQDLQSGKVTMINQDESKYINFASGDIKNLEIINSKYDNEYGTYTLNVKIKFNKASDSSLGNKSNFGEGSATVTYYYDFIHNKWLSPKIIADNSMTWDLK
ncbi:MAG: hypothetical protein Q8936_08300 [Bacillota bacterium]|nr:hypothetical protein [Bacillota bacterium]